jgi:GNAT superfamily N-acetyltransferase
MKLRPARLEEFPVLSALCLRSKGHWGYGESFLEACREVLTLQPREFATSRVMVAEDDSCILGVAQLIVPGETAELSKLFVEPRAIGRGVGSALYAWAVEKARDLGAKTLLIEADPDAAPFYRSQGAEETGSVASEALPGRRLPLFRHRL